MNQKLNWTKGARSSVAGRGIPIRFDSAAAEFNIKIKKAAANGLSDLNLPLVPGIFDLHARIDGMKALASLVLFKKATAMASGTLSHTMLHERRLEAVLRTTRKKR